MSPSLILSVAWVHSPDDDDDDEDGALPSSTLLPKSPTRPLDAQVAQHNHTPTFTFKSKPEPGRLYDTQREAVPPMQRQHLSEMASRWRQFAEWSAYPRDAEQQREVVPEDWLVEHGPDYSLPWHRVDEEKNGATRKRSRWERYQRNILRNPVVPLVFRFIVLGFSVIALTLGAIIFEKTSSKPNPRCQKPEGTPLTSPLMAIVVDAVAIVYLLLIAWDEYRGQPLGLRPAKTKVRLILLDLFFIVFDSANLSLAFEAVNSACSSQDASHMEQDALASVLLIALIAWLTTFVISIFR